MNDHCVYWIRSDLMTEITTDGYIGITNDFEYRMKSHRRSARNYHLQDAIESIGWDKLHKEIVFEGDRTACLRQEFLLRPDFDIGWNLMPGGGIWSARGQGVTEGMNQAFYVCDVQAGGQLIGGLSFYDTLDYILDEQLCSWVDLKFDLLNNSIYKEHWDVIKPLVKFYDERLQKL